MTKQLMGERGVPGWADAPAAGCHRGGSHRRGGGCRGRGARGCGVAGGDAGEGCAGAGSPERLDRSGVGLGLREGDRVGIS